MLLRFQARIPVCGGFAAAIRMIVLRPRMVRMFSRSIDGAAIRRDMMFSQQFRGMLQRGALRRPRSGVGPRNGMVELGDAPVIAVCHILLIPAATGRAGVGRRDKAVYRRLRFAAKVLFGVLRGDAQQRIDRGIHQRVGQRSIGVELRLQSEFGACLQQRGELRPKGREEDRDREAHHPHPDKLERIGFPGILSHLASWHVRDPR